MTTTRFSFQPHEGPEEKWPAWSHLLDNGQPTSARVKGHYLRHQFETPDGYLFISDFDNWAEESQHFTLVSPDCRVLSARSLGWMYCSFIIERLEWLDARNLQITIYENDLWKLTIRPRGIPYLYPRLKHRRLRP
jgi:hypothetical protein